MVTRMISSVTVKTKRKTISQMIKQKYLIHMYLSYIIEKLYHAYICWAISEIWHRLLYFNITETQERIQSTRTYNIIIIIDDETSSISTSLNSGWNISIRTFLNAFFVLLRMAKAKRNAQKVAISRIWIQFAIAQFR